MAVITISGLCGQNIDTFMAGCPTSDQVNEINKDLSITLDGVDPTANAGLVCREIEGSKDLTLLQKQIYQTMRVFKQIVFDAPLPWTDKPVYDWIVSSIKGIRFRTTDNLNYCCDAGPTINIGLVSGAVWKTTRWQSVGNGIYDMMSTVVHETRHANGNGYPHACPGADRAIQDLGSYAVQMYWWEWLAEHTNSWFAPAKDYAPNFDDPLFYKKISKQSALFLRDNTFCANTDYMAVIPQKSDFGQQVATKSTSKMFTFTQAIAKEPMTIQRLDIEGENSSEFRIIRDECTNKTLQAESVSTTPSFISCLVFVSFSPIHSAGVKSAELVTTDNKGTHVIALTGNAVGDFSQINSRPPRIRPPENRTPITRRWNVYRQNRHP